MRGYVLKLLLLLLLLIVIENDHNKLPPPMTMPKCKCRMTKEGRMPKIQVGRVTPVGAVVWAGRGLPAQRGWLGCRGGCVNRLNS